MHNERAVFICLLFALALWQITAGKTFTRCQLTRELLRFRFSKTFLSNWVCLIEQESGRNTSMFTEKSLKRKYYGLYQIPGEWCKEGRRGGKCDIACESLLDDDIGDDSACAQLIAETQGFKYWPKWEARCKGQTLPDIHKCPDFLRPSPPRLRRRVQRSIKAFFSGLMNST